MELTKDAPMHQRFGYVWIPLMAAIALVGAMGGCASKQWEEPKDYSELVDAAAAEARRLAEAREKADNYFEAALYRERADDPIGAEELYKKAIRAYPEHAASWHNLGVLLYKRGDRRRGFEAFSQSAKLDPADPRPVFMMGMIQHLNGYLVEGRDYYLEALDRNPDFLPALRESIRIDQLRAQVDQDTAERVKRALMLEPDPEWRKYMKRVALQYEGRGSMDNDG